MPSQRASLRRSPAVIRWPACWPRPVSRCRRLDHGGNRRRPGRPATRRLPTQPDRLGGGIDPADPQTEREPYHHRPSTVPPNRTGSYSRRAELAAWSRAAGTEHMTVCAARPPASLGSASHRALDGVVAVFRRNHRRRVVSACRRTGCSTLGYRVVARTGMQARRAGSVTLLSGRPVWTARRRGMRVADWATSPGLPERVELVRAALLAADRARFEQELDQALDRARSTRPLAPSPLEQREVSVRYCSTQPDGRPDQPSDGFRSPVRAGRWVILRRRAAARSWPGRPRQ